MLEGHLELARRVERTDQFEKAHTVRCVYEREGAAQFEVVVQIS